LRKPVSQQSGFVEKNPDLFGFPPVFYKKNFQMLQVALDSRLLET